MTTTQLNALLINTLLNNKHINIAYLNHPTNPPTLELRTTQPIAPDGITSTVDGQPAPLRLHPNLQNLTIRLNEHPPLRPLIITIYHHTPANLHQACQNSPIRLGTQIQPALATWLGTAGAPVRYRSPDGKIAWGILSNHHVMCLADPQRGHSQHQPNTAYPAVARLDNWTDINPDGPNYTDAAVADARINGKHTISPNILGVGPIAPTPLDATVGLKVIKAGRTTGVTTGTCTATNAAVRVSYATFEAIFIEQDIYTGDSNTFSAPGDSGSAILDQRANRFTSLLFAGSANTTVGNPSRHVIQDLNLLFPFNP